MNSAKYNPISISVLDLFASSLGAFMVLAFLSFPFITNTTKINTQKIEFTSQNSNEALQIENYVKRIEQLKAQVETSLSENSLLKNTINQMQQSQRTTAASGSVRLRDAREISGTHRGVYACSQGRTNLTLELTGYQSGVVEATFRFQHGNTRGAFKMYGMYEENRRLTLVGDDWLPNQRPRGWNSLSMRGQYVNRTFEGLMIGCPSSNDYFSVRA